jgi:very-short-patch-repair endonuclease
LDGRLGVVPAETCIDHEIRGECRPRSLDRSIGELAGRQHGVVGRWQLLGLGVSGRRVDERVRCGRLLLTHRGVYAVGHRALTVEARWMAAVLACGPGAVLSHRSAGQLWGILPRSSHMPEVTRPGKSRPRRGIRARRSSLPADEVGVVNGIPVTSMPRTLLDLAGDLKPRQLQRALNEVEVRGLTDRLSVPDLLERHPGRRGAATLRSLLAANVPEAITRSELEERFLAFLDANGLPRPRFNATLPVRGRLLEVDCMWRAERLVVELDGGRAHRTRHAFESDRQRDRILLAEGWRSARVTWRQLHDEAPAVAADLRRLLAGPANRHGTSYS